MLIICRIFCSYLNTDNNVTYDGETLKINDLYFIRDKDDTLYWTQFEYDERQRTNEFTKSVRIGN